MNLRQVVNIVLVSVLIIFIQIFVLYDISVFGLISPMVYIFLIINLPFTVPTSLVLLYSFLVGVVIDGFYNTGGMHTIPTLLVGFIRPIVLSMVVPQKGFDLGSFLSIRSPNILRAMLFIFSMTFIHHLVLFFVEAIDISSLLIIFLRAFLSACVSVMFMFIFLLFKK